jgi:hypothetical protein
MSCLVWLLLLTVPPEVGISEMLSGEGQLLIHVVGFLRCKNAPAIERSPDDLREILLPPADDGLAAIAVALVDGNRVHGSINILWVRTAFTVEEFAARHLADLKAAAGEIVAALHASARSRAPRYGLPVRARQ